MRIEGDVLTVVSGAARLRLKSAVLFKEEVTGAGDLHDLVSRVKELDQIRELGAEHSANSVIVGDHAYDVVDGFVGEPLREQYRGSDLASAARAATGEHRAVSDAELLAKLFLSSPPKKGGGK